MAYATFVYFQPNDDLRPLYAVFTAKMAARSQQLCITLFASSCRSIYCNFDICVGKGCVLGLSVFFCKQNRT